MATTETLNAQAEWERTLEKLRAALDEAKGAAIALHQAVSAARAHRVAMQGREAA